MYSIWKFTLEASHDQTVEMPIGSKVLSVESQGDDIVLYALVYPSQTEKEYKKIKVYGTGHDIPDAIAEYAFLGTVKLQNDALVFHVFYK